MQGILGYKKTLRESLSLSIHCYLPLFNEMLKKNQKGWIEGQPHNRGIQAVNSK